MALKKTIKEMNVEWPAGFVMRKSDGTLFFLFIL